MTTMTLNTQSTPRTPQIVATLGTIVLAAQSAAQRLWYRGLQRLTATYAEWLDMPDMTEAFTLRLVKVQLAFMLFLLVGAGPWWVSLPSLALFAWQLLKA